MASSLNLRLRCSGPSHFTTTMLAMGPGCRRSEPALKSALEELQYLTVDQIVVGGDVLSGPMQTECM
ncbi:MAG: hypothetical protein WA655_21495 [Candidatus Korobacteraceae bacterium]